MELLSHTLDVVPQRGMVDPVDDVDEPLVLKEILQDVPGQLVGERETLPQTPLLECGGASRDTDCGCCPTRLR